MSREGFAFWGAFKTGRHQMRFAGAVPVGFDFPAIAALAAATGSPAPATAYFFDAAEPAALTALHERLKDRENG